MKEYQPKPLDTTEVSLPESLEELTEQMSRNVHEVWAAGRLADGWKWGEERDDKLKTHPCLIPYEELPESEREYDRHTALETLKLILSLGFRIEKEVPYMTHPLMIDGLVWRMFLGNEECQIGIDYNDYRAFARQSEHMVALCCVAEPERLCEVLKEQLSTIPAGAKRVMVGFRSPDSNLLTYQVVAQALEVVNESKAQPLDLLWGSFIAQTIEAGKVEVNLIYGY